MDRISVILPTYNEKGNIIPLINEIHKALASYEHELIVVDDNSPDGTYQAVCDVKYPFVKAIIRKEGNSLAKSICCGLENASGQILIVMDTDFNHQPHYLPFMAGSLRFYDCVIGSRFLYGGSMTSLIRYHLSWIFNIFVRLTVNGKITDNLSGFFAIKRDVMERLNYEDIFWGYGEYYIRLLYYLQREQKDILQFPTAYGKRLSGHGNSSFLKTFYKYFKATFQLVFKEGRLKFNKKPV